MGKLVKVFSTTEWHCRHCCQRTYDGMMYEGQRSEVKQHEDIMQNLECPVCGRSVIMLHNHIRLAPDIRFFFVSSYKYEHEFKVWKEGVFLGFRLQVRWDADPYDKSHYNGTAEDYAEYVEGMIGCVKVGYAGDSELLTDEIFEAFKIFVNYPKLQRKRFAYDGWWDERDQKEYPDCHVHDDMPMIDGYYINPRMEVY